MRRSPVRIWTPAPSDNFRVFPNAFFSPPRGGLFCVFVPVCSDAYFLKVERRSAAPLIVAAGLNRAMYASEWRLMMQWYADALDAVKAGRDITPVPENIKNIHR